MQIFYSHSKRQKPLAREIAENLGKRFKSWIDEDQINLGDELNLTIASAVSDQVDILLLLLCRDAASSEFVKKEVDWALERESALGYNFLHVVVIDSDVLNDPHWSFVRNRKYLELRGFEEADVDALGDKLRDQLVVWLMRRLAAQKKQLMMASKRCHSRKSDLLSG